MGGGSQALLTALVFFLLIRLDSNDSCARVGSMFVTRVGGKSHIKGKDSGFSEHFSCNAIHWQSNGQTGLQF